MTDSRHESKTKLLRAALHVIRARGYSATRIEDVCEAAGLTKGSFFHHFKSKEELAIAAAEYWAAVTGDLFANAEYRKIEDPVERVLAYIDLRKALVCGEMAEFTCLVGTMVQETYETHPAIRDACAKSIVDHAAFVAADIAAAMRARGLGEEQFTAESLGRHTQAVIQGAFVLAKATGRTDVATESIDHLRRYLEQLFAPGPAKENE